MGVDLDTVQVGAAWRRRRVLIVAICEEGRAFDGEIDRRRRRVRLKRGGMGGRHIAGSMLCVEPDAGVGRFTGGREGYECELEPLGASCCATSASLLPLLDINSDDMLLRFVEW